MLERSCAKSMLSLKIAVLATMRPQVASRMHHSTLNEQFQPSTVQICMLQKAYSLVSVSTTYAKRVTLEARKAPL